MLSSLEVQADATPDTFSQAEKIIELGLAELNGQIIYHFEHDNVPRANRLAAFKVLYLTIAYTIRHSPDAITRANEVRAKATAAIAVSD